MNSIPKLQELLVLESFRKRTAMYIGSNDINFLESFLFGVGYTLDAYEIEEKWLLEGFNDWIANYYHWNESTAGWKNIIVKECNGNTAFALNKFFELYDLFRAEKINL